MGGIVRVTRGGAAAADDDYEEVSDEYGKGEGRQWEEGEWLWEVKRDGGVRVWERGTG